MELGLGDIGFGLGQIRQRVHFLAPLRQVAAEIGDRVGQALASLVIGGPSAQIGGWPDGGHDGDEIFHIVENRHDRGPQEHGIWNAEPGGLVGRQPLHQADHVVSHIAEKASRHGRQTRRQIDAGFGHQRAQGFQRALETGFEGLGIAAEAPVDLRLVPAGAPDEIGLDADHRIAPAHRAALHGFEQEAVSAAVGELQHAGDRRLQIGHQAGIDDAWPAGRVGCGKNLEGRLDFHGSD